MLDSVAIKTNKIENPVGNTIASCPVKIPPPPLLRYGKLRDYQRIGLDWLVALHSSGMNGILADEMGLGKTIQTISLLAHLATAEENWGPHLLVVPTSVLVNWEMEFKRWLPGFKVLAYYGSSKERKQLRRNWEEANKFHVLITSYNIVVVDGKALKRKRWEYLVLDEAHHIKNFRSKKWQTMLGFNSSHRLLLTGTPLQNNIMELWAFMHFLMPTLFASRLEFTQWFDCPVSELLRRNQELSDSPVVRALHKILRPFMLRRLKSEVEQQLPRKIEVVIKCPLSLRQRRLYEDFMNESSTKDTLRRENFYGMWGILIQLRKVCNHPDLFEGRAINSSFQMQPLKVSVPPQFFSLLKGLPFERVCSDLVKFLRFTRSDLEGKLFGDANSLSSLQSLQGNEAQFVKFFTESRQIERKENQTQSLMDYLKNERGNSNKIAWLPNSKNSSNKKAIKSASETAWKNKKDNLLNNAIFKAKKNKQKCKNYPVVFGENLVRLLYLNKKLIEKQKISSILKNAIKLPKKRANEMKKFIEHFVCVNSSARAPPVKTQKCPKTLLQKRLMSRVLSRREVSKTVKMAKKINNCAGVQGVEDKIPLNEKLELLLEPLHSARIRTLMNFPDKRLIQWDCGKLQKLALLLEKHQKNGDRCLIFTQMTKMLDVLEAFLNIYGYKYFRLDGSTRTDRRGALMERFNRDNSIFVFILTTRSGGYGINLTGANVVIFYDTDWFLLISFPFICNSLQIKRNPAIDMQAQDRAHRIGQTREVTIYRLISTNSVEENMFRVALNKRKMNAAVIGEGKFDSETLFSKSEIWNMFGLENLKGESLQGNDYG